MNNYIEKMADLYGIKRNDGKGSRIIENGHVRPAEQDDIKSILGFSENDLIEDGTTIEGNQNCSFKNEKVSFKTSEQWQISAKGNQRFQKGLEGAA